MKVFDFDMKIDLIHASRNTPTAKILKCTFLYKFCVEQLNGFPSIHTVPVFGFYYLLIHFMI